MKKNNIEISVIIPTWNRKLLLLEAVKSVLEQSYKVKEIIICDDGSTDGTRKLIKNKFKNHKIVKYIYTKHVGLPGIVRNIGIKKSSGNWVAFLDSDDIWYKDKLKKQIELIYKYNCKAICTNVLQVNSFISKEEVLYSKNLMKLNFKKLLKKNLIHTSTVLIKKQILNKVNYFSENKGLVVGEDYNLWLKISLNTIFYYTPEILIRYNNNPDFSIRKFGDSEFDQKNNVLNELNNYIDTKHLFYKILIKIELFRNLLRKVLIKYLRVLLGKIKK